MLDKKPWDDYWTKRAQQMRAAKEAGLVVITRNGTRLHVSCPFDAMFNLQARDIEGDWLYRSKVWAFPSGQWLAALNLIVRCFGRKRLTPDWLHYLDTENKKHE